MDRGGAAEAKRQTAQRLDQGRFIWHGYHGPRWLPAQLRPLSKLPDANVAKRIGRTVGAYRQWRNRAGIPTARDGRRR